MRKHAKKCEKILKKTTDSREYKRAHTIEADYTLECCFCPREHGHCGKHCNPTRFIKRNWKKFRNYQWKNKKRRA